MEHIERAGRLSAVKVRALILTIFSPFLPFFEKHSAKLKYCILAMAVCLIERRKKKSLLEKSGAVYLAFTMLHPSVVLALMTVILFAE